MPDQTNAIQQIRSFNRFYTKQIGVLESSYLHSQFSLAEVRILYELAHREHVIAKELETELAIDAGYLSRILENFENQGLIRKEKSKDDARRIDLSLTGKGKKAFAPLDQGASNQIGAMIGKLSAAQLEQLLQAMKTIASLLAADSDVATQPSASSFTLRAHRPGDIGWVTYRHGVLYAQEYGYDERFEALVAEVAAKFVQNFDPKRDRCWIAEKDGERVGSVFLVKASPRVAKLRLLLVEPSARGFGLGKRLVEECIRFARKAGYRKITLWTHKHLHAAISIYKSCGFHLAGEKAEPAYGKGTVGQVWEMKL